MTRPQIQQLKISPKAHNKLQQLAQQRNENLKDAAEFAFDHALDSEHFGPSDSKRIAEIEALICELIETKLL